MHVSGGDLGGGACILQARISFQRLIKQIPGVFCAFIHSFHSFMRASIHPINHTYAIQEGRRSRGSNEHHAGWYLKGSLALPTSTPGTLCAIARNGTCSIHPVGTSDDCRYTCEITSVCASMAS